MTPSLLAALVAVTEALRVALEQQGVQLAASDNVGSIAGSVDSTAGTAENADTMSRVKVVGMTAEEFHRLREASGYTQAQVAKMLGIAIRTVGRWESGTSRIDGWKAADLRWKLQPGAARSSRPKGPGRGWWGKVADSAANVSTGQDRPDKVTESGQDA